MGKDNRFGFPPGKYLRCSSIATTYSCVNIISLCVYNIVHIENLSLVGNRGKEMVLIRNDRVFLLDWNLDNILITAKTETARMHPILLILASGRHN